MAVEQLNVALVQPASDRVGKKRAVLLLQGPQIVGRDVGRKEALLKNEWVLVS
jgi:hypothetical protein